MFILWGAAMFHLTITWSCALDPTWKPLQKSSAWALHQPPRSAEERPVADKANGPSRQDIINL